jgi:hypothetical protein
MYVIKTLTGEEVKLLGYKILPIHLTISYEKFVKKISRGFWNIKNKKSLYLQAAVCSSSMFSFFSRCCKTRVFIYCMLSANGIEFLYLLTRIETLKNTYIEDQILSVLFFNWNLNFHRLWLFCLKIQVEQMHCLLKQYHPYVVERHGKVSTQGTKRKQGLLVKQYLSLN